MATKLQLPPYPLNANPGSYMWNDWWQKLQDYLKQITEVNNSGTDTTTTTIPGAGTADVYFVQIANFVQFSMDIPCIAGITSPTTTTVDIPTSFGAPIKDGNCMLAALHNSPATCLSLGVGVVSESNNRIVLPPFTIPAGTYNNLVISGMYYVT